MPVIPTLPTLPLCGSCSAHSPGLVSSPAFPRLPGISLSRSTGGVSGSALLCGGAGVLQTLLVPTRGRLFRPRPTCPPALASAGLQEKLRPLLLAGLGGRLGGQASVSPRPAMPGSSPWSTRSPSTDRLISGLQTHSFICEMG